MSDLQLFRISKGSVAEIEGQSAALEKSLQSFIEKHLDTLFGVRFLASEFSTGKAHKGRIDTLGIDENGSPVIIEYKRALNENVINQGLFYLDWLLDHRGDFRVLVLNVLGPKAAENIDWSSPRLICVAGNYTRYDEHAVKQIDRTIDLVRYRKFADDLLLIELVHSNTAESEEAAEPDGRKPKSSRADRESPFAQGIAASLKATSPEVRDLFHGVEDFLKALGDDVTVGKLKYYWAFRRLKNFACLEVQKKKVVAHLVLDPTRLKLEDGFTRNMRGVGHFGTGDLQVAIASEADFEKAKSLLVRAYEGRS